MRHESTLAAAHSALSRRLPISYRSLTLLARGASSPRRADFGGSAVPDLPQDLVAALSERYRLREEIGAGGMATVYLADDLRHGRPVAIKVLKPELAVAVGSNRFLREIEVAASLTHPHVLPLHDSGEEAGFLYYVMPFIEGQSLRERLDHEGPLPVSEALRLFRQIVDALAAAHARGIVHRDVKPANILLTGSHALVADFGVAKAVHQVTDRTRLTSMGVAMGTPRYMSPEQASGDPETDHRSDLFAAGAVAYEMMTGRAPFDGENTRAVFAALLAKTPVAPRVLRDTVPQAASDLVMRCLEKEAADRPQSAEDLLAELDAAVTPPSGVAATGAARSPLLRRSLGSAAVAVLLVAGIAGWRWNQSRVAEREARESIPTVLQLVNENRLTEAARLAEDVEASVGEDPVLRTLWPRMSSQFRIVTNPPGAAITYRPYDSQDEWRDLGTTPFESDRFPVGAHHFRLRLDGFEPVDRVRSLIPQNLLGEFRNAGVDYLSDPSYVIDEELVPSGEIPDGMVSVAGGVYSAIPVLGFGSTQPSPIPPFLIDRTEVTNEAYARFVADGGYDDPALWGTMARDGRPLSLDEARPLFVDETGRRGPSSWSLGQAPSGADELPVGGVSWFEADAYCRWAGKELPTLYHWARATLPSSDAWIPFTPLLAAASNFDGTGPAAVGSRPGSVGVSGAVDLAGNVREWVSTPTGSNRLQTGGAWSDPAYRIHDAIAWDPWTRSPENGFRCADYQGVELPEPLLAGLEYPEQDLTPATMPDDVYRTLLDFHRYDRIAPSGVPGGLHLHGGVGSNSRVGLRGGGVRRTAPDTTPCSRRRGATLSGHCPLRGGQRPSEQPDRGSYTSPEPAHQVGARTGGAHLRRHVPAQRRPHAPSLGISGLPRDPLRQLGEGSGSGVGLSGRTTGRRSRQGFLHGNLPGSRPGPQVSGVRAAIPVCGALQWRAWSALASGDSGRVHQPGCPGHDARAHAGRGG